MYVIYAGVQEDKIDFGFKSLVREIERVMQHGFIESELTRIKAKIKSDLEVASNEKDKTESRKYKFKYKDHYLSDKPYLSIENQLFLFKLLSNDITIENVNDLSFEM